MWLVIPAAIGIFLVRTLLIARKLKFAAASPSLADARALRDAKRHLRAHREQLEQAVASPSAHLANAKRTGRIPAVGRRFRASSVDRMVDDAFTPPRA